MLSWNLKNIPAKIREKLNVIEKFSFSKTTQEDITAEIKRLDKNKPTTFNNIPAKLLKQTNDICAPLLTKIYNDSKVNSNFPEALKMADITPAYKKDDVADKGNYRLVSNLPAV